MSKKPSAAVVLFACAIAVLPAGAAGVPAVDDRLLLVNFFGSGGGRGNNGWVTHVILESEEPIAKITLTAPSTYPVTLDHAPGTTVGFMQMFVSAVGREHVVGAGGDIVVETPTRYASDPTAQACAPGPHAAVWRVSASAPAFEKSDPRRSFELPIFVDRPPDASLVLRFCPIWRTANGDMSVSLLEFTVEGVLGRLRARGWNTWRALVSPPLPTLAPDEVRTFKLRAHEPIPQQVTVRARHDPKSGTVVVSGKATAVGEPQSGVKLTILASREWWDKGLPAIGEVTTDAAGEYSFRYRERRSTVYLVTAAFVEPRACGEPSTAPAGCASESASAPPPGGAPGVRIRRPNEARLAVRSRDQALADRIGLKLADLPARWLEWSFFSEQQCRAFKPDLRRLTASGWSESGRFLRHYSTASSRVTVYVSEEQARTAFDREARLEAARCLADEVDGAVLAVRAIETRGVGDEQRAFRIVLSDQVGRRNLDLISFRRGRTVVHLAFVDVLGRVQRDVTARVAARARRA